jgi:hypothetical protein
MSDMRVVMTHVLADYPKSVMVQWDIEAPDPGRVSGITFTLQRSGSPRGEWVDVATGLSTIYYVDTFEDDADDVAERNLYTLDREIWYRAVGLLTDGTELYAPPIDLTGVVEPVMSTDPVIGHTVTAEQTYPLPDTLFHPNPAIQSRLQLVQDAVHRRSVVALQEFTGVRIGVLKKRHFGTRCTACFEPVTKQVLYSNCTECYATGWVGGYFPAIGTLGRVMEGPLQTQTEEEGETEMRRAKIDTINFPHLIKHDILVELDSNRRWEVDTVEEPYLRRRRILQFCTCSELARTHPAYTVPVEQEALTEIFHATAFP